MAEAVTPLAEVVTPIADVTNTATPKRRQYSRELTSLSASPMHIVCTLSASITTCIYHNISTVTAVGRGKLLWVLILEGCLLSG